MLNSKFNVDSEQYKKGDLKIDQENVNWIGQSINNKKLDISDFPI